MISFFNACQMYNERTHIEYNNNSIRLANKETGILSFISTFLKHVRTNY